MADTLLEWPLVAASRNSLIQGGPALPFTFGPGQALRPGDLDSVARGRLTPRTAFDGRIPEDIHAGGPVSSFAAGPGQLFHHGNLEPRTFDELTHEAALGGRIHLGNHECVHGNGPTPVLNLRYDPKGCFMISSGSIASGLKCG